MKIKGKKECPCCDLAIAKCLGCGKPGIVHCFNIVGCSDEEICGSSSKTICERSYDVDKALHFTITCWNRKNSE